MSGCNNVNTEPTIIGGTTGASAAYDAFGRQRISSPLTLFDSSHRYADNDLFSEDTTGSGSSTFDADGGFIDMDVTTASGDEVLRESKKVISYQPGKSLLIMNSFQMEEAKTNLRQRVGYFTSENGFFVELNDSTLSLVKRSYVTGSAVDTKVNQSSWNGDKLDGTGASGYTLDMTKAQLQFMDLEWLGVGSVRMGFVINGQFIIAHTFHFANLGSTGTYMTTASLCCRYEITNTGTVASASTLKQVCSTAISEGGYELRGRQQAIGTVITSPYTLTTAGTYYPLVSIRLKSARLDAIAILTALSILGTGNGIVYNWRVAAGGSITGGSWVSAGTNSSVEYNITGTAYTIGTGRILASGFFNSNNQSSPSVDILKEALFKFQLERDSFTSTPEILTVILSADTNTQNAYATMDWEEVTR